MGGGDRARGGNSCVGDRAHGGNDWELMQRS